MPARQPPRCERRVGRGTASGEEKRREENGARLPQPLHRGDGLTADAVSQPVPRPGDASWQGPPPPAHTAANDNPSGMRRTGDEAQSYPTKTGARGPARRRHDVDDHAHLGGPAALQRRRLVDAGERAGQSGQAQPEGSPSQSPVSTSSLKSFVVEPASAYAAPAPRAASTPPASRWRGSTSGNGVRQQGQRGHRAETHRHRTALIGSRVAPLEHGRRHERPSRRNHDREGAGSRSSAIRVRRSTGSAGEVSVHCRNRQRNS